MSNFILYILKRNLIYIKFINNIFIIIYLYIYQSDKFINIIYLL